MALIIGIGGSALAAENADAAKAQEEKPSRVASETERKKSEAENKAHFSFTFNDVSKNLVIIEYKTSLGDMSGSGFIAKMDGKTYLFTNQHVIMGADSIVFKTVTGEKITPLGVELSVERDIARLPIEDREDALIITDTIAKDIPIAVFGNSDGVGVASELHGKINGLGPDLFEVSADFVSGNSGSPVINTNKEVIGIASYVYSPEPNWINEGTKFENQVRRFCYRLTNVKFTPVNWRTYNEKYGKPYLATQNTIDSVLAIVIGWGEDPFRRVPTNNLPDISLNSWSANHNKMVERMADIIEKNSGSRSAFNKLRDEISQSATDLSNIMRSLSSDMKKMAKDPALTGFLQGEFESYATGLEYLSKILNLAGQEIADYIDSL